MISNRINASDPLLGVDNMQFLRDSRKLAPALQALPDTDTDRALGPTRAQRGDPGPDSGPDTGLRVFAFGDKANLRRWIAAPDEITARVEAAERGWTGCRALSLGPWFAGLVSDEGYFGSGVDVVVRESVHNRRRDNRAFRVSLVGALQSLLDATEDLDVQEAGGQPLALARQEAFDLLYPETGDLDLILADAEAHGGTDDPLLQE